VHIERGKARYGWLEVPTGEIEKGARLARKKKVNVSFSAGE
jgi:hypothetical protein